VALVRNLRFLYIEEREKTNQFQTDSCNTSKKRHALLGICLVLGEKRKKRSELGQGTWKQGGGEKLYGLLRVDLLLRGEMRISWDGSQWAREEKFPNRGKRKSCSSGRGIAM